MQTMITNAPNFIVHYSRGIPFRSITNASIEEYDAINTNLDEKNSWGLSRFLNSHYFLQRLEVEKIMHQKFIEMGGKPVLSHPIYFFLGRNTRFEEHPLNIGYVIELSEIDKDVISFSYGDTMLSFNEENRKVSGEIYKNPLCDKLFRLDEIEELFENKLVLNEPALAIEAHLWIQPTDEIVQKLNHFLPK